MFLIFDIHNEISKLYHFVHFYFWPLWPHFEAIEKTFLMKVIQQWKVGRLKGFIKGFWPTKNKSKIPNTL